MEPDRPAPSTVVASIADNAPKLAADDAADSRGARAEVVGLPGTGRPIYSHIGYWRMPMVVITAWYTTVARYNGIEVD